MPDSQPPETTTNSSILPSAAATGALPLDELDHVDERRSQLNTSAHVIIASILSIAAFTYLGRIVQPVLVAIFLFFMIKPAADWLTRRGLRPWVAWLVLFALVVMLGIVLTQVVYSQAEEFTSKQEEYRQSLLKLGSSWTGWSVERLETISFAELFEVTTGQFIGYTFEFAATFLEFSLMVFFYLMFVILDARDVPGRIRRAFGAETADHLMHVGHSIVDGITDYMRVKTLVSLGMGATAGALMWAFGVPYWQLWAFLTFLFNYVTYIGSLLILVPPIVTAFAVPDVSAVSATVFSILLCLNRFVWIDYVEIHHSGRSLNINSILILMSLAYWGTFWGVLGLILAVPMLTCAKIVLSNFEGTKRLATLMTED